MKYREWLEDALENWYEHYNYLPKWNYNVITGSFSMQLFGCEVVLQESGRWYMNDTSGA